MRHFHDQARSRLTADQSVIFSDVFTVFTVVTVIVAVMVVVADDEGLANSGTLP